MPPRALLAAAAKRSPQPEFAADADLSVPERVLQFCVASGTELHLVRPMGFVLSDRELRRSAMDYWPRLKLTVHDDTDAFLKSVGDARAIFFSTKGKRSLWQATFRDGDFLVFGSETKGIDTALLDRDPDRVLRIPQTGEERCLNLSTAVGIGLYEALRQIT